MALQGRGQRRHRLAPGALDFAQRQEQSLLQVDGQIGDAKGGVAEAADGLAQGLCIQGALARRGQGRGGFGPALAAVLGAQRQAQGLARAAAEMQPHGQAPGGAHVQVRPAVAGGIAGPPEVVAGADGIGAKAASEAQDHLALIDLFAHPPAVAFDGEDVASDLPLLRPSLVEHHAVAGLDRVVQPQADAVGQDLQHLAQVQAAVAGVAADHQRLVAWSFQKAGGEAVVFGVLPAREDLRQSAPGGRRHRQGVGGLAGLEPLPGVVQGLAVGAHGTVDVLRAFEAALDLEAPHSGPDQPRQQGQGHQVLGREQVVEVPLAVQHAVHQQAIGQAAGLGALAAVGGAAAPGLAGEALAAVADAERAMHEGLQFDVHPPGDGRDLVDGQLPAHHHPPHPQRPGEAGPLGVGDRHLGAGVQGQMGRGGTRQAGHPDVLHDEGVHPAPGGVSYAAFDLGQLLVEHQGVEGEIAAAAVGVDAVHGLGQPIRGEAGGAGTGVEAAVQAEVDGVGAGVQGGLELRRAAGGGEDLGTALSRHRRSVPATGDAPPRRRRPGCGSCR